MEVKKRYCPSCGNKTNDGRCEICGRATKPVSMRIHEVELDIIEDDVAGDNKAQFSGDQGYEEAKLQHAQSKRRPTLQMKAGEHPYYEHSSKAIIDYSQIARQLTSKLAPFLVVIIIIIIAFVLGLSDEEKEPAGNNEPAVMQGNFFDHVSEEHSVGNLTCSLTKKDGKDYVMMENNSEEYISADLMSHKAALRYVNLLPPHTTLYAVPYADEASSCSVENATGYKFDFNKPEISYHLIQTKDDLRYDLDAAADETQIQNMLMYTLSGYIQSYFDYYDIEIYIKNEIAYDVFVEIDEFVHVNVVNRDGFEPIDSFRFDLT